ncbi:MAG: ABC transporter permease [Halioglobus sp.]|nr:ABC transporter permease [Halioglobus sp.]
MYKSTLSLTRLALTFIPGALALLILAMWFCSVRDALYAKIQMVTQLLLTGYVLAWIFSVGNGGLVMLVLVIMLLAPNWIALRAVAQYRQLLLAAYQAAMILIFNIAHRKH